MDSFCFLFVIRKVGLNTILRTRVLHIQMASTAPLSDTARTMGLTVKLPLYPNIVFPARCCAISVSISNEVRTT